jgi:hypothetical protein
MFPQLERRSRDGVGNGGGGAAQAVTELEKVAPARAKRATDAVQIVHGGRARSKTIGYEHTPPQTGDGLGAPDVRTSLRSSRMYAYNQPGGIT